MVKRVLTALVGIPSLIFFVYTGGTVLGILLLILALLALRELAVLAGRANTPVFTETAAAAVACFLTVPLLGLGAQATLVTGAAAGGLLAARTILATAHGGRGRALSAAAGTVAAAVYVGVPLALFLALRGHPREGLILSLLALVLTWSCDTAAFFVGRWRGGTRLAPRISPGKTVAGAVGGVGGSMAAALAFSPWVTAGPGFLVILGIVAAAAGQAGDLVESWLKRRAGVKDAGGILPGHGGVLDRFDSFLFVVPVVYLFFALGGRFS